MKLVKIVKYQRVWYGDLEEGEPFMFANGTVFSTGRYNKGGAGYKWDDPSTPVKALDLDKYPPEVTYNIEGIPEDHAVVDSGMYFFSDYQFGEIETRMI